MAVRALDIGLAALQCYFLLMNVTVERYYCHGPLLAGDSRFLVAETVAFCKVNNQLFLARPDWMVMATCFSAYGLALGYLLVLYAIFSNGWRRFAVPLLLLSGWKVNAILFYHAMEFTSNMPPQHLGPYFAVEGPYLVSLALVMLRAAQALYGGANETGKSKGT